MCVILSVYKQKGFSEQVKNILLDKTIGQAGFNQDGFSLVAFNRKNKSRLVIREMKFDRAVLAEALDKFDCVNLHLRQATSGKVNENNLHFWHYKGWYMAHNGMVNTYGVATGSDLSDSYIFFRQLVKTGSFIDKKYLNIEMISAIADRDALWGRLIFVQPKNKKVFYFGDFKSYLIPNEVLIVSSASLSFNSEISCLGLNFEKENAYWHKELDGVFAISLALNRFYQVKDEFLSKWGGSWSGSYNTSSYFVTDDNRDLPLSYKDKVVTYPDRETKWAENDNNGYKSWQNKRKMGFV